MSRTAAQIQTAIALDRIFHPTDFSAASEVAFVHALKIATHPQGRLTMLHTEPQTQQLQWAEFPKVRQTLERWGILSPHSRREEVADLGMSVAKIAAWEDDVVAGTLEYLAKHPHDLIVLATHQYDGLERWLHKAVAEPIARQAGELALFVPEGVDGFVALESGAVKLRNILIPVDRHPHPQMAIEAALSLATLLHEARPVRLDFTLLHAGDDASFPKLSLPAREAAYWHRVTKAGNVEQAILETAREYKADLIVMATEGRHGFLDALRGSTTERIVRQADVPVLTVPAIESAPEQFEEAPIWQPVI